MADWTVNTKARNTTLGKKVLTEWHVLFNDRGDVTAYYLPEASA